MADKSTQLILEALTRAAADPTGLPLFAGKNGSGLFAATAPAKQAAKRCKDDEYLRVVRTEKRGKAVQEICVLTDKGLEYLLDQASPRQVLEDLVRAVEARQEQLDALLACAQQTQSNLDAFKATAEKILHSVSGKDRIENLYAAWASRAPRRRTDGTGPGADPARIALTDWRSSGATEDCPLPELYRRGQANHAGAEHRSFPRRPAPAARAGTGLPAPLDRPASRASRTGLCPAGWTRNRLLRQYSQN